MRISINIKLLFIIGLIVGVCAQAQTFKWVDEKGVTHYGDSIPPEYKDRGNVELSKRGIPVKKTAPAPTAEQRQALEEEERKQKEAQHKAAEQKRKDIALMNTYTSEQEIDVTRNRNIRQVEIRIKSAQERIADLQARINQQKQALKAAADQPAMAKDLERSIQDNEKKVKEIEASITQNRVEIEMLNARYEAEKIRFRELSQPKAQRPMKLDAKVAVDESLIKTSAKR